MTKLIKCDCAHDFQDQRYGKQVRVANLDKSGVPACTVCGKKTSGK